MDQIDIWKPRLARRANSLVLGDDQRVDGAVGTWFGRVTLRPPGEAWPTANSRLMWPLLQIVVHELPFRPAALDGLALIRVFVDPTFLVELDTGGASFYHPKGVSGQGWLLLASPTLDGLEMFAEPEHGSRIRPAPGHWELIEKDYPTEDELPTDFPDSLMDEYGDRELETHQGTKVGGWPFNAQSPLQWGPWGPGNSHPYKPEYVFQIDSHYDRGWAWGHSGFAYFGRGTGKHRDKWAMEWQCY